MFKSRTTLGLTSLEAREVPAIDLIDGVITITGNQYIDSVTVTGGPFLGGSNPITVVHTNSRLLPGNNVVTTTETRTFGVRGERVESIRAELGNGNNSFTNNTMLPSVAIGGSDVDVFIGGTSVDNFSGLGGNDDLQGRGGHDILNGGSGSDILSGGSGDDLLNGGDGHDILRGDNGNDTLVGGLGTDTLYGGAGQDVFWWNVQGFINVGDNNANGTPDELEDGAVG